MAEGEALRYQPDPEPAVEQVRLGDQTYEMDPQTAAGVRQAFENLGAQYGAQLEALRRQSYQAPQSVPGNYQPPPEPEPFGVPDPDLLFQNKGQWTSGLANSIDGRITGVREEAAQLVQGAVNAFQQELNRRDAAQEAKRIHDAAMEEMLQRRGLTENRRMVGAVYADLYHKLEHLPLELALDKVGAEAQQEIERIRAGEKWTMVPAQSQPGVTQRPPAVLRSARRAAPAPAPAARDELESPGGGYGTMSKIILKYQKGSGARG